MAIIKLNNNALTSVTELPSGLGGDPDVKVDVARLGLRVFANQNLAKQNSNSASYDVFQDSTGITNLTGAVRDSAEFITCVGLGEHTSDSNTTCLLHFNNNVTDEKGDISWTANNMSYSTSIKKLGTHSGSFNGSNGNVSANTSAFNYTGDHTIEFWFYLTTNSGERICFEVNQGTNSGNQSFLCNYHNNSDNKYYTYGGYTQGGSWDLLATNEDYHIGDPDNLLNAWHHYAHVKNGSNNQLYLDGVSVASTNDPWTPNVSSTYAYIGGSTTYHGSSAIFQGYIDEFRASSVARYTSNFTPNEIVNATGSFEGTPITAGSSTSKMGAVITYTDNAGTNALNSDLVLKLSADNGSNYSTATLTALPDFSSGVKCCSVADLSVTAGTQLKYKIEFANQSSSKNARITGVSLQY